MEWPIYFGTEVPGHEGLKGLDMKMISLRDEEKYFLESRYATVKSLPEEIEYILPMQEDFLLERFIDKKAIEEAIEILDTDQSVASIRLMPCPGPRDEDSFYKGSSRYKILGPNNTFMYSFQATLWRRSSFESWYKEILKHCDPSTNSAITGSMQNESIDKKKKAIEVDWNISENSFGQGKFKEVLGSYKHLAYIRAHPKPNAVYLSPWPYRPTAVEKGVLGHWVPELAQREGFPLQIPK